MAKITFDEAMAEFFPEGVPKHLLKSQPKPQPKLATQKAEERWSGKSLSAVLQDAQRADEAATKGLRDKREQWQKDRDAKMKADYDRALHQAAIDAAWQRSLAYRAELAQWRVGGCNRGPGDPDWQLMQDWERN
jgi:exonuclease V gamma subunit